jgi:hypothetical protein
VDTNQTRALVVLYLEAALEFVQRIDEPSTAYLIERALDEARSKQFSELPNIEELH